MIGKILRRLTRERSILLLTLAALACLPFPLRKILPDAGLSLLLPVTLLSAALAWGLARFNLSRGWIRFIFIVCAPLVLLAWIAQIGGALLAAYRESFLIPPQLLAWIRFGTPIDFSTMLAAQQEVVTRLLTLGQRVAVWLSGTLRGETVQDPAARAFVWALILLWLGAWCAWQVRRDISGDAGRDRQSKSSDTAPARPRLGTLIGLFPATALLAWVLNSTAQESFGLWLHLAAVVALLGIVNYEKLAGSWRRRRMDFSDSTWEDTLIATGALTVTLIVAAYLAAAFSVEEIRERIREWDENRSRSTTASSRSSDGSGSGSGPGIGQGLEAIHPVRAGPQLSTDIVMIIVTGDRPAIPQAVDPDAPYYYWRTMTYQNYLGSGWANPAETRAEIPPGQPLVRTSPEGYRLVRQEVTFPSGALEHLYWTGTLVLADTPMEVAWRAAEQDQPIATGLDPLLRADLIGARTDAESYVVESLLPQPSENDLRTARAVYPEWVTQRYLRLPDSVPERVRALARDLTATAFTPYDRAVAIETYLRQIPYNLEVPAPPAGRDVADYFIFDLQQGYCDYYATAMTVLARAAGLPARFVIGYASGRYNPLEAHYVVTQADSHAWVEIYFPGIGWVEFEPTPSQPTPVRSNRIEIPPFTPDAPNPITWTEVSGFMRRLLRVAWRPAAALVLLYVLWIGTETLRLNRYAPPDLIQRLYGRLRRITRLVSGLPAPSQTAAEYAAALSAGLEAHQNRNGFSRWLLAPARAHVRTLTGLYTQSLFAPRAPGRAEARHAVRTWSALGWRLLLLNIMIFVRRKAGRLATDGGSGN